METKATKIIRTIVVFFAPVFLVFAFIPTHYINGEIIFGYKLFFTNAQFTVAFLLPIIGSLLLLLHSKVNDIELISIICLLLGGVFILTTIDTIGKLSIGSIFAVIFAFSAVILLFFVLNQKNAYSTYDIVEGAMLIGLAIAFDLPGLKIQVGSGGGSISFTMVPLFILAIRQGPLKGFIGCGIVYGIITCLMDGWGLATYPFDYLLGYGAIALVGFFKPLIFNAEFKVTWKSILFLILGIFVSIFGRFAAGCLSSMILYEYKFVAALTYNVIYILPSGGVALVILLLLYKPLINIEKHFKNKHQAQN